MNYFIEQRSELSRLEIDPAGEINLPAHLSRDPLTIGGLTTSQAEERIQDHLAGILRHPQVSLIVETYGSAFVSLFGEIDVKPSVSNTGPGRYALSERTTLLDFILIHGALTEQSDITAVMVTDASGRSGVFDLSATMYAADMSQNPVLERGDNVLVPSTAVTQSNVFVIGEVRSPSILQPRSGMTILDAITVSGGPTEMARTRWVTLIRGRGSDATFYQVPYRDILRNGDMESNVALQPGDIVYLGTGGYQTMLRFFRDSFLSESTSG